MDQPAHHKRVKSEGGHWQCWVWLQDDKVVGLLGLCDD